MRALLGSVTCIKGIIRPVLLHSLIDLAQAGQAGKSACRTLGMLYAKLDQLLAAVMNNILKKTWV